LRLASTICADCQPGGIGTKSAVPSYCEGSKTSGNSKSLIDGLHVFGCRSDNLAHLRLREELAQCRYEIEGLGDEDAVRHVEAVLGNERRPPLGVQPARRTAVSTSTGFAETALLSLNHHVGRQKCDQVRTILDQRAGALVQAQLITGITGDARIVDGSDLGVRDQDDEHVANAPQPIDAAQEVDPPLIGHDPALAESRAFNRSETAIGTYRRQDQRLEFVEAVEDHGLVFVRRVAELFDSADYVGVTIEQPKGVDL